MRKTRLAIFISIAAFLSLATRSVAQARNQPRNELVLTGSNQGWPSHAFRPLPLPDDRLLVVVGNTVYLLDANRKQLWKYEGTVLTSEPAYSISRNEIAVVMYDLQAVRLSAETGRVLWKGQSVGRGVYSAVCAYRQGFLALVDMSGYRQGESAAPANRLEYWGESERDFWYTDFPQGDELVVSGTRIYALHRGDGHVTLREVELPSSNDKR